MINFKIHLPSKYRLDINIVKRRKIAYQESLLPRLDKVLRARSGNKISRFFRHIFEHKNIKKNIGVNLAILATASSFVQSPNPFSEVIEDISVIQSPLVLNTQYGIQYPVDKIKITQGYKFYHPGIDLDGKTGDDIKPIMAGKVEAINYSKVGYGNAILVNHGSGILSLYAHLSKIFVKKDNLVDNRSIIGTMGATGRASGDHLHLEIYEDGKPINPLTIIGEKGLKN